MPFWAMNKYKKPTPQRERERESENIIVYFDNLQKKFRP